MRLKLTALAALTALMPAAADDSSAMLGAGGIVFTKNTPVRMAAEDLTLSPNAVRIRFEFENPTAHDVKTIVAFPLPDISTAEFWGSAIGTLTDDPRNFVGFKVVVDGKPVPFTIEQRGFLKNKDVTAALVAAGAPINPAADDGYNKLSALAPAKVKALKAAGLVADEASDVIPQWTARTRFYWTQVFPAKKTVVIEHSYQPVTGQSFFSTEYMKRGEKLDGTDYCFDGGTWAGLEARTAKLKNDASGTGGYMNAFQTSYILTTAGNWQGPIGRFHLTLDKLKPDNVLSLCWDGALKQTGPTTFEFSARNYAPKRDLHIVVMEVPGPIGDGKTP